MAALRIGTRGSPLALAQARLAQLRLAARHPALAEAGALEIVPIRTSGDRISAANIADAGGKGLFTREIEEALLAGTVDVAVHSMKDMPAKLPDGLIIAALLPREDPRDALIAPGASRLSELPRGARVGTSSLRRAAILLHRRGDLSVVPFRGNVDTRLKKLAAGEVDATVLAYAGLKRLDRAAEASCVLETDEMLPSPCQGAIGLECRESDARVRQMLDAMTDAPTAVCIAAERAMLAAIDGSCRTPFAGLAELAGEELHVRGLVIRPDGSELIAATRRGPAREAAALGRELGAELKRRAGPDFFVP
jgi:hydroxymethylbilane synthase